MAPVEREPRLDDVEVAVIGGGFAGLTAGARLKQAGIDDVRIIEKGGDFGGTWYWNRYPGAQCDVESYVYLPLLEETGYVPTEKYARAPEILEHCRRIAEHFDLYDNACLSTEVTGRRVGRRRVRAGSSRTNRGDRMSARFLVMGNGPLHRPEAPRHPGHRGLRGPLVPHQPVGLRLHRRRLERRTCDRPAPTSGSASSAPAPRRCRWCPICARRRRSSSSSSARRRRSTCGPTDRPIRTGRRRSSPAGSASGWRTSRSSPPAASPSRTS